MSKISQSIKEQVKQRAGSRCEYCQSHQDYVMGWLQIDHVHPVSKGGTDTLDNLCLACELCNQHKWTKTYGYDSQSRINVPLFNPRQQKWSEHLAWSSDGTLIIGLTANGRATIAALKLNNKLAVTVRRNWVRAGWHPPKTE